METLLKALSEQPIATLPTLLSAIIGGSLALAGIVLNWFLQEKRRRQQAVERGKKYQIAIEAEVHAAMEAIEEKINWMSRDITDDSGIKDTLCVYDDKGRRLFLGEEESMTLSFPLWEKHMNEVVEALDTESFRSLSKRISLANRFVAKLGDLKIAFECERGDAKKMAQAIFKDMRNIQTDLSLLQNCALCRVPREKLTICGGYGTSLP